MTDREEVQNKAMRRIARYAECENLSAPKSVIESELKLIGDSLIELLPEDLIAICEKYAEFKAKDVRRRVDIQLELAEG